MAFFSENIKNVAQGEIAAINRPVYSFQCFDKMTLSQSVDLSRLKVFYSFLTVKEPPYGMEDLF